MKFWNSLLILVFVLSSCTSTLVKEKSPGDMSYNQAMSFIQKNQKKESPELYQACEKVLPLTVENRHLEDYVKVIAVYKKNPDVFLKAMTLAELSPAGLKDPVFIDSLYSAAGLARKLSQTEEFTAYAREYYGERNFSEDELRDRLTGYRAFISDRHAMNLIAQDRNGEALRIYEEIVEDYRDTDILLNYAKALNRLNRYEQSLITAIEALKMTPGSLDARNVVSETAELLGYSKAEINTMIEETVFVGRNLLRQNLLADELNIPMPAFRLKHIDGSEIRNTDFQGKILIVSFFATWCPPCRMELPHLNDTYLEYRNDPEVAVIAVSTDEDTFLVPPFVRDNGFAFPVYYAGGINRDFEVKGIPTLFVVDKNGIIRYKKIGYSEGEEFGKIMSWYIDEIKAAGGV
ncbi:MAG: TlpA disulfide reductase family protein [Candidatus Marinimicrobia bacterium]|jgi:thiol-disulfide isomerase/thioredoxin|nr:TlpA disulfide reductase family protein [Candidatus Neomarinimicrobiota bacterium]MDD4960854.1 TlpA disulfide reductase family protein [Candidatus Neomarinimicrobiota bacterium]MDD5710015.1 TlpA disulfide reductase family protein [Candidatus Neomarinimicrobiota bacterium]MDX9778092.1 TlpA disulfide reductase family protein [bacterium]